MRADNSKRSLDTDRPKFILIDGHSLLNRAFYALPAMNTSSGEPTNAVYGFATMLMRLLDDEKPDSVVVTFDMEAPTFRHSAYSEYKAHRPKMPDDLKPQIPLIRELVKAFNLAICEKEGYEADDVIGTLALQAEEAGYRPVIVTGDKDALQLVSPATRVLITRRGITDMECYDEQHVEEVLGITVDQVIDYKALVGDKSDNIPGVAGVGAKTAVKLLKEYGNVSAVLESAAKVGGKLGQRLQEAKDVALLSLELATIDRHVPVKVNWDAFTLKAPDMAALSDFFIRFEMRSLLEQVLRRHPNAGPGQGVLFGDESQDQPEKDSAIPVEHLLEEAWAQEAEQLKGPLTILAHFSSPDPMRGELELLSVGNAEKVAVTAETRIGRMHGIIKSGKQVSTHDLKRLLVAAGKQGLTIPTGEELQYVDDLQLVSYLINPAQGDHSLADLAIKEGFGILPAWPGKTAEEADVALGSAHRVMQVAVEKMRPQLDSDLEKLYRTVEMPLVSVLARMELTGIAIDRARLAGMSADMEEEITRLQEEIYSAAGTTFNVNSPRQLGKVLYEDMGIPVVKKTKTGPSTSADVLEELADDHAIARLVLDFRQLVKLKGTYVDALPALVHPETGRIHSTFNQAVTTTGRLSSTNPNLQNIPVRTGLGKQIRGAFIPGKPGWELISADYSQIELRVLAHLSGDENLIEAFRAGVDIHTKTAAEVFGHAPDEVTSEMRSAAKAINFGIVYGISSFGLARGTGLSRKEAQAYIDEYFHRYPGVKHFMEEAVSKAKSLGYVSTVLGRRRYLPDIASRNWVQRKFAERTAMNTPIQGSAADIIKVAMLRVDEALHREGLKTQMLLQVHDELVFEGPREEREDAMAVIREAMEGAFDLSVPLDVDVAVGPNWLDVEELADA